MDISAYINALINYPMERIDGQKVIDVLYDFYDSQRFVADEKLLSEYNVLYEQINHKSIREITEIELPLHRLINQYEMRAFREGIKIGLLLANELREE